MTRVDNEESRIRAVYAKRDATGKPTLYGWQRHDVQYMAYRQRATWALAFMQANLLDLADLEVLDVGCGSGDWLRMLIGWGAAPRRLHGVDLLEDRIAKARVLSPPELDLRVGSGCQLLYPDGAVDLCVASTVFSSILDVGTRLALAREMIRVVRPDGWLMLFDYAISDPRNPDTIGINQKEIDKLFAPLKLRSTFKLILAPPILRRLPAKLLGLAHILEVIFPLACTHRLYSLQK